MRKIQFGAGSLGIDGWENYDDRVAMDISKPLPIESNSVDACFSEHCIEHVTPQQAWTFLNECYRILKPHGLIRITIPDFSRILRLKHPEWLNVNRGVTGNDGSVKDQMKSVLFAHGHQSLWTSELLKDVMTAIGFVGVAIQEVGQSAYPDLMDLEQHHRSVGKVVAWVESGCVDGLKP